MAIEGLYNGWGIRTDGIKWVKEKEKIISHKGDSIVVCSFLLDLIFFFYSCCRGLELNAKNLSF